MRTEHAPRDARADPVPGSARLAGAMLVVLGVANAVAAAWGLAAATADLGRGVAIGLVLAGVATVALGVLVGRGSLAALYVGLVVFELLLIPRLLTLGEAGDGAWVSLVLLLVLVAVLWVATVQARRRRAGGG